MNNSEARFELTSGVKSSQQSTTDGATEIALIRACRKSLKPLQRKTLTGLNAPRVQAYELKSVQSLVQHDFRNVPKS